MELVHNEHSKSTNEQLASWLIYQLGLVCRSPMEKEELIKEYLEEVA